MSTTSLPPTPCSESVKKFMPQLFRRQFCFKGSHHIIFYGCVSSLQGLVKANTNTDTKTKKFHNVFYDCVSTSQGLFMILNWNFFLKSSLAGNKGVDNGNGMGHPLKLWELFILFRLQNHFLLVGRCQS